MKQKLIKGNQETFVSNENVMAIYLKNGWKLAEEVEAPKQEKKKDKLYSNLKVKELKSLCDERDIKYKSNIRKADLVRLLEDHEEDSVEVVTKPKKDTGLFNTGLILED